MYLYCGRQKTVALYLRWLPKILATLRHLVVLHMTGDLMGTPSGAGLLPPVFKCMQSNPLPELYLRNFSLPTEDLSPVLPPSIEILQLHRAKRVEVSGKLDIDMAPQPTGTLVAPCILDLDMDPRGYQALSLEQASFFSNLTTLDVTINGQDSELGAEPDVLRVVHQGLISRSPSLQDLTVYYEYLDLEGNRFTPLT
jgi:hypothetical protein